MFGGEPHGFVDPARLHLFGIRSIDTGERRLLQNRGVDVVDMRRLDEDGFAVSIRRIIDRVRARNGLLHVSLDVDFLDPAIAPGVGTAVPGGATYREAHLVMELLYESGLSPSLDLVELNPFLDERGKSALLLVDLTASLFGRYVYRRTRRDCGDELTRTERSRPAEPESLIRLDGRWSCPQSADASSQESALDLVSPATWS